MECRNSKGASVKKIRMTAPTVKECLCEKCGNRIKPNSKGRRYMNLKHRSMGVILSEINVGYNRYTCPVCSHYWKEDVPFKVKGHMMTLPALNALLFHFMENTAMAVMARLTGISAPTVYRLFYDNIEVPHRTYHLPSVLSIDEFRATSDEGTFAFHITNPITGKTLDIVSDRTMSTLLDYFSRFSHEQKKKVKIVVMDLSGAFNKIIRKIFPNAKQVADKFHYVKVLRQNMTDARVRCMKRMDRKDPLYRVMKKNIHLFDQYHSRLNNEKAWMLQERTHGKAS
jgi:transposase